MDDSVIRVGVIGLGAITKYYLSALQDLNSKMQLAAVCDLDVTKLQAYKNSSIQITTSIDELLQQDSIEAVIINLPNDLHFGACAKAIAAGKHVCCEKPLALSPTQADMLVKMAEAKNVIIFTAFHRRYNIHMRKLAEEIKEKNNIKKICARYFEKIEDHCNGSTWYLNPDNCGGGVIADNGPNIVDLVLYLLGDISLNSAMISYDRPNIESKAIIFGKAKGGIDIEMQLDWAYQHGECKDVIVEFCDGTIRAADMLHGFHEFKSSLYHEYVEILKDFILSISAKDKHISVNRQGATIVHYIDNIYKLGKNVSEDYINEYFSYRER
jgi:predicted dehydrogenase